MKWLANIFENWRRKRRRNAMWKARIAYTWNRPRDFRDYTGNFRRENSR